MTQYSLNIRLIGATEIGSLFDYVDELLEHSDPRVVELAKQLKELLSQDSEYQQTSGSIENEDGTTHVWAKEYDARMERALARYLQGDVNSWISVKDNLPREGEIVIGWNKKAIHLDCKLDTSSPTGWRSWSDSPIKGITHWRPSLSTPKE